MQSIGISNVFDLMGWLCMLLSQLSLQDQINLNQKYRLDQQTVQIEENFCFLRKKAPPHEGYMFLSSEQLEAIRFKAQQWYDSKTDQILLLYLISYLAGYFDPHKAFQHFLTSPMVELVAGDVYRFAALNQNYKEVNGCLIPDFVPCWQKKNRRSPQALNDSPFSRMKHYLWIPYSDNLYSSKVTHLYVSSHALWIDDKEPLVVAASPCLNEKTFRYSYRDCSSMQRLQFQIDEYLPSMCDSLEVAIENILEAAARHNAHILMFPEMIASPQLIEKVRLYLNRNVNSYPPIICLPSTETPSPGKPDQYQNTIYIVDSIGNILAEYHKQHPYVDHKTDPETGISTEYYEPIFPDYKLPVFHIEGVGRVGIVICADVFSDKLMDFLFRSLQLNILLVSSYTSGTDAFFRALAPARSASCDVIWCNTCAAYPSLTENRQVTAYFPYGHLTSNEEHCCSCQADSENCHSCMCTIHINPQYKCKPQASALQHILFSNDFR